MGKRKIDREKLARMLRKGKSQEDCAKHFGVTPAAISYARREIAVAVYKHSALTPEVTNRISQENINIIGQLNAINEKALTLLEKAMTENDKYIALNAMKEVRSQLGLQLEIYKTLFDFEAIKEFQTEILNLLEEVDPDVKRRIIEKLKERRSIRSAVKFD